MYILWYRKERDQAIGRLADAIKDADDKQKQRDKIEAELRLLKLVFESRC